MLIQYKTHFLKVRIIVPFSLSQTGKASKCKKSMTWLDMFGETTQIIHSRTFNKISFFEFSGKGNN